MPGKEKSAILVCQNLKWKWVYSYSDITYDREAFYLSNIYFWQSRAAAQSFTRISQLYWNKFSIWIIDAQTLLELVKAWPTIYSYSNTEYIVGHG